MFPDIFLTVVIVEFTRVIICGISYGKNAHTHLYISIFIMYIHVCVHMQIHTYITEQLGPKNADLFLLF